MQSVTIAIPTHNRAELLEQTLISLAEVVVPTGSAVDLLIIADACTDGTVAIAEKLIPTLPFPGRVMPFEFRNLNRGRNACVEQAKGEIVLFLDDDVWVSPGLLDGHLEVYRSTPASIVAGHIELWWRDATRPDWMSDATAVMLTERRHEGTTVRLLRPWDAAGANFSIRRNAVIKVGRHFIEGFAGPAPLGHHATLAMPEEEGSIAVSVSPFRLGMTCPGVFSDPANREYQSLASGAAFTDLARVPSRWKEPPQMSTARGSPCGEATPTCSRCLPMKRHSMAGPPGRPP